MHRDRPHRAALLLLALTTVAFVWSTAEASAQTEAPGGTVEAPDDELRPREDTYETPRGVGMGAGARAGAVGTSALAYNPANLSLRSVYHVESMVSLAAGEGAWNTGGAVVDSITGRLAAGLAFRGVFGGGARDFSGWDGRLSLGMAATDMIALGVSARYINVDADDRTVDDQPIGEQAQGFTVDSTFRVTPVEGLHIAGLFYNLVNLNSSLAPQRMGGGVAYAYREMFEIGFDTLVDISTFDSASVLVAGGLEFVAAEIVPLRLGFQHDTGRTMSSLTLGVGFVDAKVSLDLSLRQDFGSDKQSLLLFALRYHVE